MCSVESVAEVLPPPAWKSYSNMRPTCEITRSEGHVWKGLWIGPRSTQKSCSVQQNTAGKQYTPPWDTLESDSLHKGNSFYQSSNSSDKWAGSAPLFYTLLMLLWALIDRDAVDVIISFGSFFTNQCVWSVYQRSQQKPNNSESFYRPNKCNKQTASQLLIKSLAPALFQPQLDLGCVQTHNNISVTKNIDSSFI